MTISHADLVTETFASFPRRPDARGRRTVLITEAELTRRVLVLLESVQRTTARAALLYIRRSVSHAN